MFRKRQGKARLQCLLIIPLMFVTAGCSSNNTAGVDPEATGPTATLISYTGCKEFASAKIADGTPADQDCIEYEYDGDSVLLIRHINAGFNCCPDLLTAVISIVNNTISITEEELLISGGCRCLCLFDLDYKIRNLPPGEYRIVVIEPYTGEPWGPEDEEMLEFTVDLSSSASGSYCVERNHYPWGLQIR